MLMGVLLLLHWLMRACAILVELPIQGIYSAHTLRKKTKNKTLPETYMNPEGVYLAQKNSYIQLVF